MTAVKREHLTDPKKSPKGHVLEKDSKAIPSSASSRAASASSKKLTKTRDSIAVRKAKPPTIIKDVHADHGKYKSDALDSLQETSKQDEYADDFEKPPPTSKSVAIAV